VKTSRTQDHVTVSQEGPSHLHLSNPSPGHFNNERRYPESQHWHRSAFNLTVAPWQQGVATQVWGVGQHAEAKQTINESSVVDKCRVPIGC